MTAKIIPALGLVFFGGTLSAQTNILGLGSLSTLELLLVSLILIILIVGVASILGFSLSLMKIQERRLAEEHGIVDYDTNATIKKDSWIQSLINKWTDRVPVEKEEVIMLDHEYDGIHELDNSLPPWWVALFNITIVFSVIYMFVYHFSGIAEVSSSVQYEQEVAQAEEEVRTYLARQGNTIDETNVELLADASAIESGKNIFLSKCAVCHGQLGEGGIGPNLTDDYWIHGGGIQNVFKTVKYGVPEKGMVPWQNELLPAQMQEVSSFILTLHGTNPPNGKEAQGEIWTGGEEVTVDDAE